MWKYIDRNVNSAKVVVAFCFLLFGFELCGWSSVVEGVGLPCWSALLIAYRDGKEPSFIGFGSVRVLVNFLNGGFSFCSGSMTIMVRFGFGFF